MNLSIFYEQARLVCLNLNILSGIYFSPDLGKVFQLIAYQSGLLLYLCLLFLFFLMRLVSNLRQDVSAKILDQVF